MSEDRIHDRVKKIIELEEKMPAFQARIQELVNKYGTSDATLAEVKDIYELDHDDLESWELYKKILADIDNLEEPAKIQNDCEQLQRMNDRAMYSLAFNAGKKSKGGFMNWMNNRNPLLLVKVVIMGKMTMDDLRSDWKDEMAKYL